MREIHTFDNADETDAFCESRDDATAVISNSPRPGQYSVSVGPAPRDPRDMTLAELFEGVNREYRKREERCRARYETALHEAGVWRVAQAVAQELGLQGREAYQFSAGFCGVPARAADPRAEGLEPVFRQGRKARSEKGVAERCRAAEANLRSTFTYTEFLATQFVAA